MHISEDNNATNVLDHFAILPRQRVVKFYQPSLLFIAKQFLFVNLSLLIWLIVDRIFI